MNSRWCRHQEALERVHKISFDPITQLAIVDCVDSTQIRKLWTFFFHFFNLFILCHFQSDYHLPIEFHLERNPPRHNVVEQHNELNPDYFFDSFQGIEMTLRSWKRVNVATYFILYKWKKSENPFRVFQISMEMLVIYFLSMFSCAQFSLFYMLWLLLSLDLEFWKVCCVLQIKFVGQTNKIQLPLQSPKVYNNVCISIRWIVLTVQTTQHHLKSRKLSPQCLQLCVVAQSSIPK